MKKDITCCVCGGTFRGNHNARYCKSCYAERGRNDDRAHGERQKRNEAHRARVIDKQTRRTLSTARKMLAAPPLERYEQLRPLQRVTMYHIPTGEKCEVLV